MNRETIIESMKKKLFIRNIEGYNYVPNSEFYMLCCKIKRIPYKYVKLLKSNDYNTTRFEIRKVHARIHDKIPFDDYDPDY